MKKAAALAIIILAGGVLWYLKGRKMIEPVLSGGQVGLPSASVFESRMDKSEKAKRYELAKELVKPQGFINTGPFKIADLFGNKVVLLDFWTYSCINCQRTLPYLKSWWGKYKDQGLVIVGVHTPEFDFEKKYDNVLAAVKKFGIEYPVVQDNDYGTWDAYGNRYWPREYLIDIDGYVVHDHIGEGGYDETEKAIQEALAERMAVLGIEGKVSGGSAKPTGAVDVSAVGSPEIYFGASRNSYLASGQRGKVGLQTLSAPAEINKNALYLAGDWNFSSEFAENKSAGAKIIFRYQAKNVYFVADSPNGASIKVLLDGKSIGAQAGPDVKAGAVLVKESRLYHLIGDSEEGTHTLEIIIEKPGLRAFTFTFG